MSGERRYWKNLGDPHRGGSADRPRLEEHKLAQPSLSRRRFLKAAGFAVPVTLVACHRAPVEKAIPFLVQPETVVPGRSLWYASTCLACEAACGVLVKNRDGRPIKLEGNPDHPLSRGGLCARGQASVLELYDERRLASPVWRGEPSSWQQVDGEVTRQLAGLRTTGGAVRFLTGTVVGPTLERMIGSFLADFTNARHVMYDSISYSAILDAHALTHGARVLPRYRFDLADTIVSFDADFLGTWIAPVEHTAAWQSRRRPTPESPEMSFHVQIESRLSVTGSKADRRWAIRPGMIAAELADLSDAVARRSRGAAPTALPRMSEIPAVDTEALAERLWSARGRSLVVCGVNDLELQLECNRINHLIGAYGATIDVERPSRQAAGDDSELARLVDELEAGDVAALVVSGVNPAYDLAAVPGISELLAGVPLLISFARWEDETARLADAVCPDHHAIESWGDAAPVAGVFSLVQPAIAPLGETRSVIESLAEWRGQPAQARDLVQETWRATIHPLSDGLSVFEEFWNQALERGVVEVAAKATVARQFSLPADRPQSQAKVVTGMDLVLHATVAMGDGRPALNPWLHELPDPITKVTWDNVAALSPGDADRLGVTEGDVVRLEIPGPRGGLTVVELPVFVQPGQADGTVAAALGYGRAGTERFATIGPDWIEARGRSGSPAPVGMSLAPFVAVAEGGARRYSRGGLILTATGRRHELACTQTHHSLEVPERLALPGGERREVVREVSLATLGGAAGGHANGDHHDEPSLWPDDHPYTGHHWGLVVDLSVCTGCSACVVGCQAENNIPVVGRDEVRRRREMHWLRIDTYFTGDGPDVDVVHQPMMCHQCDNAPCETVCPVLATVHSEEGLNEQVYNRCVGTRYCANNCPYKVRRFNWFNYRKQASRQDLVLNPDVTVRSRGVMEKCTFCAQRIMEAKLEAKAAGRPLADGNVRVACEQSCPAGAIVFGDVNDPASRVAEHLASPRRYKVLEELGVRPSVAYLAVVRRTLGSDDEEATDG